MPPEIEGKVEGVLFPDREKLDRWRNNWVGLRAEFPQYDIELRGAIDELLLLPDGTVAPLDFKTRGYPTKDDSHEHYQYQLNCYALLLQRNGMKPAKKGYLLFFWPQAYHLGAAQFATNLVELPITPEEGEAILAKVAAIVRGPMPEAHRECVFCQYRDGASPLEEGSAAEE
jgi:RecB family exonuclease